MLQVSTSFTRSDAKTVVGADLCSNDPRSATSRGEPRPCLCTTHRLSTTSTTGRSSGSILLEPTASITSSNGRVSTENRKRFVLGIPMPPANICHVGVSIVTWHAVQARSKSPSCTPASSPLLPIPTSSTQVAPGYSSLSPKMMPSGNGAVQTSIRDDPFEEQALEVTKS